MKKNLKEELIRIHQITYGKKLIKEGFIDDILQKVGVDKNNKKIIDDPKKADLVNSNVIEFFKTLEDAANSGGLKQQSSGQMNFQKSVESMQIGLSLLGYEFPKYGIDGLFGPETGKAVQKFNSEHVKSLNEDANELRSTLDSLGYEEKGSEITSGGNITDDISSIVSNILKDYKATSPNVKVVVTSGNDNFHKRLGYKSKHTEGNAVDIVLQPYNTESSSKFISVLDDHKRKDSKFSYIDEYRNPSKSSTGGHFHLQYGGKTSSGTYNAEISATPEMLNKLVELLKTRGVKPEELKVFIDAPTASGEGFSDIDLTTQIGFDTYSEICQKFITENGPNPLGITGEMMANGAKSAFERFNRFVPPELALSQLVLEGGIRNKDVNSRPIRTKNPFNVGNVDTGANVFHNDVQSGINSYYNLIARSYLGKGKNAKDLITNFVNKSGNRYATAPNYEKILNTLSMQVHNIAKPIISKNIGSENIV
jgi:hypothetical protein